MLDRINRKGKISCRFPFVPIPIISKMKAFQLTLGVSKFIWSICFRRTFLTDNNLTFDESIRFSEDVVYATSALIHAKKIESLPTICYCYNRRPDNPTSLSTKDETRKERVGKMILFSKAYKNIDAPKKYRKYLRLSGFLSFVVLSAYNVIVHIQNKFRKNG
jgi:hypothetical protein